MKISVDFGAIQGKNYFGTKVFAINLRKAIEKYDTKNQYYFYDFHNTKPKLFWNKISLSIAEFINKPEIFLALNQSIPLYVNGKIISFSHGLSFYFYPQYYQKKQYIRLKKQLFEMVRRSYKIIVSSIRVKNDFKKVFKNLDIENKINVIPFGVPEDMVFIKRNLKRKKFFLTVGGNQPIKNYFFIKKIFYKFKKKYKDFQLINADDVSREKLIDYYQQATALLTSSFYESFNFPVIEALTLGCPVVGLKSAIIPEFRNYVNIANNESEFIKLMINLPIRPNDKIINEIKKKFNWQNYVDQLIKLYK